MTDRAHAETAPVVRPSSALRAAGPLPAHAVLLRRQRAAGDRAGAPDTVRASALVKDSLAGTYTLKDAVSATVEPDGAYYKVPLIEVLRDAGHAA